MKTKSIILGTSADGRPVIVEQLMKGAISSGFVVSSWALVFDSKKEAAESLSANPCKKGYKCYTLTDTQAKILDLIKNAKPSQYIRLSDFLKLK